MGGGICTTFSTKILPFSRTLYAVASSPAPRTLRKEIFAVASSSNRPNFGPGIGGKLVISQFLVGGGLGRIGNAQEKDGRKEG